MPTFNQLVRKGREALEKKSTAPALLERMELHRRESLSDQNSPQKRGVCTAIQYSDPQEAELGSP